ncbi:hypothetical protein BDW74DRAFT_102752 [Aspergillus multicolor]|uniref:uncharacterized protein n=1 Tax=Aspergillus multicolor TaxID=41759 RepID=UPI003CCCF6EE
MQVLSRAYWALRPVRLSANICFEPNGTVLRAAWSEGNRGVDMSAVAGATSGASVLRRAIVGQPRSGSSCTVAGCQKTLILRLSTDSWIHPIIAVAVQLQISRVLTRHTLTVFRGRWSRAGSYRPMVSPHSTVQETRPYTRMHALSSGTELSWSGPMSYPSLFGPFLITFIIFILL